MVAASWEHLGRTITKGDISVDQTRAVITAAAMIGSCLLAQLGYTVSHDLILTKAAEQERREQAAAYKSNQAKEAWDQMVKNVEREFESWLENGAKPDRPYHVSVPWAWVKNYDHSDVTW